jgi:hypothetical protein
MLLFCHEYLQTRSDEYSKLDKESKKDAIVVAYNIGVGATKELLKKDDWKKKLFEDYSKMDERFDALKRGRDFYQSFK